jgi:hypothetical protein
MIVNSTNSGRNRYYDTASHRSNFLMEIVYQQKWLVSLYLTLIVTVF